MVYTQELDGCQALRFADYVGTAMVLSPLLFGSISYPAPLPAAQGSATH